MSSGFVASSTNVWRASVGKVTVDSVAERVAKLTWSGQARTPFTVFYGPVGSRFRSQRSVAHPYLSLKNLRPGISYDVRVVGDGFDSATSFTTVATAGQASSPATEGEVEAPLTELSRLEIRAGKIIECEKHPDADTLYVEKVDVGQAEPRTIVSGLVNFVPLEEMIGRNVVVLCNLKPRTMRGVTSHGMLLCASNEGHTVVDPLAAPDGTPLGELVTFEGHKVAPVDPGNRATKAFDRVAADLKTNENGVAFYQDVPFGTSEGPCISPGKVVGSVS